jgi:drug/metabolite transporter (DMT)-like permease
MSTDGGAGARPPESETEPAQPVVGAPRAEGRPRAVGLILVLAAAVCFGTLSIFVKLAYRLMPVVPATASAGALAAARATPLAMLAVRYLLAAIVMWAWLGLARPRALLVGRRNIARIAAMGLTGYGFASICFFFALTRIDASLMAIILFTFPTLVALASVRLFDEPLTRARSLALLLTFVGVALAVWDPAARVDWLGILIGLGAPLGYSLFMILAFRWRMAFEPEAITAWMMPVTAVPILLIAGPAAAVRSAMSWPPAVWLLVLAMALIPSVAAISLEVRGLARLGAPAAAVASTFEPIVTVTLAVVLLGEHLTLGRLAGAVLVLGGVAVAEAGPALAVLKARRMGEL